MTSITTSATTRAALTGKLLGIKRENGWTWKHICADRRHVAGSHHRRHSRSDEALQAAGGEGRRIVRTEQDRTGFTQRGSASRLTDAAD